MFESIGILAKPGDARVEATLDALVRCLRLRGLAFAVDETCAALLGEPGLPTWAPAPGRRELVIVIGGDGTLLRAAQQLDGADVLLLGVNLGRLGFLADLAPDHLAERLGPILDGEFVEDQRLLLDCEVWRAGAVVTRATALNDVVLERAGSSRLIGVVVHVDGRFLNEQRCDGIIVTTPTGSTAYSLSGGGPILHPALDALGIVPICPHNLSNRPIVVNAGSEVDLRVTSPDRAHLTCDGEQRAQLAPGDRVRIRRAARRVRLIHPRGYDYFATLRVKLAWGQSPC